MTQANERESRSKAGDGSPEVAVGDSQVRKVVGPTESTSEDLRRRNAALQRAIDPLPGRQPYDNDRPLNIPGRMDGRTIWECVLELHPHIDPLQWRHWFRRGDIRKDGFAVAPHRRVRGGEQFVHRFPDTVEPLVNADIKILAEDAAILVVHKPAPLPVHPCGRFNRHTLTSLLRTVYAPEDLRVVHRLDANTTGVMVLARTRRAATELRQQFQDNRVRKSYLVRCLGVPETSTFVCDRPIGRVQNEAGMRSIDNEGRNAKTEFDLVERFADGTSLLEARPITGRTNQIRVHLWSLGIPVMGDPSYLPDGQQEEKQTLAVDQPPMCLHAHTLQLSHPLTGETLTLRSEAPGWHAASGI